MIQSLKKIYRKPLVSKFTVAIYDALIGGLCMYLVIHWRYTFEDTPVPTGIAESATIVFMVACISSWILTDTYKAVWRFTSLDDIRNLFQAVLLAVVIAPVILFFFFNRAADFPRSVPFIVGPLYFFVLTLSRVIVMFFQNGDVRAIFRGQNRELPNAILLGTERSLHNYLRDMTRKVTGPGHNVKGLIGTDADNRGRSIRGIPVLGNLDELEDIYTDLKNPLFLTANSYCNR